MARMIPDKDSDAGELPELLELSVNEIEEAISTWVIYRALDRKVLPSAGGFLDQDDRIMTNLFYLDDVFERVKAAVENDE